MERLGSDFTELEVIDFMPCVYGIMQKDKSFTDDETFEVTTAIVRVLPKEPFPDDYGRGIEAREEYERARNARKIASSYVSIDVLAKLMFSQLPFANKKSRDRIKQLCTNHWKEDARALEFLAFIAAQS